MEPAGGREGEAEEEGTREGKGEGVTEENGEAAVEAEGVGTEGVGEGGEGRGDMELLRGRVLGEGEGGRGEGEDDSRVHSPVSGSQKKLLAHLGRVTQALKPCPLASQVRTEQASSRSPQLVSSCRDKRKQGWNYIQPKLFSKGTA